MFTDNLYNNLHRSTSGWDEDFLTEGLVHLLKYLQEHEPEAAYSIMNQLAGNLPKILGERAGEISISTQFSTPYGVPDICIKHPSFLVLIEVKVDADFGADQLQNYRRFLYETELRHVMLNTLTRYGQSQDNPHVDWAIRWNQLADTLERSNLRKAVSKYLRDEFVGFLKVRGVAMDKVEWDLVPGVKSMLSLLNMIAEALAAAGVLSPAAGSHSRRMRHPRRRTAPKYRASPWQRQYAKSRGQVPGRAGSLGPLQGVAALARASSVPVVSDLVLFPRTRRRRPSWPTSLARFGSIRPPRCAPCGRPGLIDGGSPREYN